MSNRITRSLTTLAVAAALLGVVLAPTHAMAGSSGTITLELYKAGFIVGGSGGTGTLHFGGKTYRLALGGVSLGATVGVSKAELIGHVYNLKHVSDIEGTYSATGAGLAVAGGEKVADLKNGKGVQIKVQGKQIGLEVALDLSGMEIKLKRSKK